MHAEDNHALDAEYRAFVRQLHPRTIEVVAEVDRYWHVELYREVSTFSADALEHEYDDDERQAVWDRGMELQDRLQNEIRPQLNWLAFGHPDPDVRRAADVLAGRLQGVVSYHHVERAKRADGEHATTAINLAHSGMVDLRRAAYHAPFRTERPAPEYDGIGVVEPMASQLKDIPPSEY